MSLYRSKEVGFFDLVIPGESAWDIMNQLGELGYLEFVDLNEHEP